MVEVASNGRARVLDPIERVSEVIFGLLMAMTFIGALNVATAGREEVRTMMITALGCNLAWGLADAVMYLVRTATERTRNRALLARLRGGADAATGQALVALALSGQVPVSDTAYQRGVAYLLRTQLSDGSWLVRTRTFPFQPYKESGFPHGKNQWISAAGSSWAAMAISLTTPVAKPQLTKLF